MVLESLMGELVLDLSELGDLVLVSFVGAADAVGAFVLGALVPLPLPLLKQTDGISDGISDGMSDGISDGISEGMSDGILDVEGISDGISEGILDEEGMLDSEGSFDGWLENEGLLEAEGVSDGMLEVDGLAVLVGSNCRSCCSDFDTGICSCSDFDTGLDASVNICRVIAKASFLS